jgi:hypothetical protein
MKKEFSVTFNFDQHVECFGKFNNADRICKSLCALRIRCIIERDQNVRLEILEELVSSDGIAIKIQ